MVTSGESFPATTASERDDGLIDAYRAGQRDTPFRLIAETIRRRQVRRDPDGPVQLDPGFADELHRAWCRGADSRSATR